MSQQNKYVGQNALLYFSNKIKALINLKVDKVDGKGLSSIDVTQSLKDSWDSAVAHKNSTHAPTNAQANIIDTIKVNGTIQTITNKVVDVPVPTKVSQLSNDSGFQTSANVATAIANKVDKVTGKGLSTNDLTAALKTNYDAAYSHSTVAHAPATAQKNSDITKAEIEAKLTGRITTHVHDGIPSYANDGVVPSDVKIWIDESSTGAGQDMLSKDNFKLSGTTLTITL